MGIPVLSDLAELYIKQFKCPEAERLLKDLMEKETPNLLPQEKEKLLSMLGICKDRMVSWQKRVEKMEGLLKNAEANYGGHLESGYFYFRIRNYDEAERAYQKAIEEVTSNASTKETTDRVKQHSAAYYGLAHTYIAIGKMERAVEVFEKAIDIDPGNSIFYRDLGLIAIQNNDVAAAESFLNKAIELGPEDEGLYKLLGDLYLKTGYAQKAILLYEEAIKKYPVSQFLKQELAFLYKEGILNGKGGK
jgi:tetratricopeptide (TPR) repeat protein